MKKTNDVADEVAQQEYSNNKYYTLAFTYNIYRYRLSHLQVKNYCISNLKVVNYCINNNKLL